MRQQGEAQESLILDGPARRGWKGPRCPPVDRVADFTQISSPSTLDNGLTDSDRPDRSRNMFAYADEAGNTGGNLFDEAQPWFITIALMTRADFDILERGIFGGVDFHANALGMEKLEEIAPTVLRAVKRRDGRFFISRVEKRYLATTKLVDTVFDSYENKGVPWHIYNLRPLKLLIVFKLAAFVLNDDLIRMFWDSLMQKNSRRASEQFVEACRAILERVDHLPDERSREIVAEAFAWAIEHFDKITVHSTSRLALYGHMPNTVAFTNLLDGIERQSKAWSSSVKVIKHDRQTQFEKSLAFLHEMFSNADPTPVEWPSMPKYSLQKAFGSKFEVSTRVGSVGIQVVDIILWLFGRLNNGDYLYEYGKKLMNYVLRRGYYHDFSFDGVYQSLEAEMKPIMEAPFTEEELERAREDRRQDERRLLDLNTIVTERLHVGEHLRRPGVPAVG